MDSDENVGSNQHLKARIDTVERIYSTEKQISIVSSGVGGQAAAWFVGTPGASKCLHSIRIPYAKEDTEGLVGHSIEKFAHPSNALDLAWNALQHFPNSSSKNIIAIGACGALATLTPKRGSHRVHVCSLSVLDSNNNNNDDDDSNKEETEFGLFSRVDLSIELTKGARSRYVEDGVASAGILYLCLRAACPPSSSPACKESLSLLESDSCSIKESRWSIFSILSDNYGSMLSFDSIGRIRPSHSNSFAAHPRLVVPGSFNPLHDGHRLMCEAARKQMGIDASAVTFELGAYNPDKGNLPPSELARRVVQFRSFAPVCVTNVPLIIQKARLFPGAMFCIGFDTAVRLCEARYYNDNEKSMRNVFNEFLALGTRFLVASRLHNKEFQSLDELVIPSFMRSDSRFEGMFVKLESFRKDISSTEIRAKAEVQVQVQIRAGDSEGGESDYNSSASSPHRHHRHHHHHHHHHKKESKKNSSTSTADDTSIGIDLGFS